MTDKPEQWEIPLKTIRGARVFIAPNDIPAIRDNAGVYLVVHAARDIVADLINQHIGLEQEAEAQRIRAEAAEQELREMQDFVYKIAAISMTVADAQKAVMDIAAVVDQWLKGSQPDGE